MNDQTVRLDKTNDSSFFFFFLSFFFDCLFVCCLTCWIQKAGMKYHVAKEYKTLIIFFAFYQ